MFLLPTDLEHVSSVATLKIAQEEVFRGHSMYFFLKKRLLQVKAFESQLQVFRVTKGHLDWRAGWKAFDQ